MKLKFKENSYQIVMASIIISTILIIALSFVFKEQTIEFLALSDAFTKKYRIFVFSTDVAFLGLVLWIIYDHTVNEKKLKRQSKILNEYESMVFSLRKHITSLSIEKEFEKRHIKNKKRMLSEIETEAAFENEANKKVKVRKISMLNESKLYGIKHTFVFRDKKFRCVITGHTQRAFTGRIIKEDSKLYFETTGRKSREVNFPKPEIIDIYVREDATL